MRILAIMLALFAAPAWSLSCMRPDIAQAYAVAQDDPAEWIIVAGRFTAGSPGMSWTPKTGQGTLMTRLEGRALTRNGFTAAFSEPVAVEVSCVSQWCGTVGPKTDYVVFLRKDEGSYRTFAKPCPNHIFFFDDAPKTEAMLTACLRGSCPQGRSKP